MRLLVVSDAWFPQVNGVVRTVAKTVEGLKAKGWEVQVLGPQGLTLGCPTYPEIRLTLNAMKAIKKTLQNFDPTFIHIATEGPLGLAMRAYCCRHQWSFTTSFHTRFPEYIHLRFGVPLNWTYQYLRYFHGPARRILVPTRSIQQALCERGFDNTEIWGRGVDIHLFRPDRRRRLPYLQPIQLYVGRIAVEKNVEDFLRLKTPGTKIVVGEGPERSRLQKLYPEAVFLGALFDEELATVYASSDVFVFPSRTDTFGLVLLEALASGTPVAAYPVPGPQDVITERTVGILSENLGEAIASALALNRSDCRAYAARRSWARWIDVFERSLVAIDDCRHQENFCLRFVEAPVHDL